jgi:hypothetical protein
MVVFRSIPRRCSECEWLSLCVCACRGVFSTTTATTTTTTRTFFLLHTTTTTTNVRRRRHGRHVGALRNKVVPKLGIVLHLQHLVVNVQIGIDRQFSCSKNLLLFPNEAINKSKKKDMVSEAAAKKTNKQEMMAKKNMTMMTKVRQVLFLLFDTTYRNRFSVHGQSHDFNDHVRWTIAGNHALIGMQGNTTLIATQKARTTIRVIDKFANQRHNQALKLVGAQQGGIEAWIASIGQQ